jgi:hypothetical protein
MVWFYFLYLLDILKYSSFLKYNSSGYDERPCINNETSISIIRSNHEKMILLKYLENNNNSQQNKLDKIYNSRILDLDLDSSFIPNITKGIDYGETPYAP